MNREITVRLDRIRIASWAKPAGAKPPPIAGFTTEYDRFIRPQGKVATYQRARSLRSPDSGTRIAWQYMRKKGWLKAWSITINGDDQTGITPTELRRVLSKCRFFSFVLAELAIDFSPSLGVDRRFVRRHAVFGKSRRQMKRGGKEQLRYGTRHSAKLVRCYWKKPVSAYRVEVELHSQVLKRHRIGTGVELADISFVIFPKHFRFVGIRWKALSRHLERRFGHRAEQILTETRTRGERSIKKATRYLRKEGVHNTHRFLKPLRINDKVEKALLEWSINFQEEMNEYQGQKTKETRKKR